MIYTLEKLRKLLKIDILYYLDKIFVSNTINLSKRSERSSKENSQYFTKKNYKLFLDAMFSDNIGLMKELLDHGFDVNFIDRTYTSRSLLNIAIDGDLDRKYLDIHVIELLLSVGANPNYIPFYSNGNLGDPPIINLLGSKRYEELYKIASLLILYGANIKIQYLGVCPLTLLRNIRSKDISRSIYYDKFIDLLVNQYTFLHRLPYLSLTEGCPQEKSHIGRYLFNELVCRDICTFLFEDFWN